MSQSVKAIQESVLPLTDSYDNSSYTEQPLLEASLPTDFSFLHSKAVWAFATILILVLARIFGSKQKLPAGVKRLPGLPGLYFPTAYH